MIKIEDKTGELKQSLLTSLRREFDSRQTSPSRLIEIAKTTKELDKEFFEEMKSDLEAEGIITIGVEI